MLTKLSILGILLSPALAQFGFDIRPDVSFNDNNDRFDVTDMMSNKKSLREMPADDDDDSEDQDDDYRRNYHSGDRYEPSQDILSRKNSPNILLSRKSDGGFAYEDRMDSVEGGTIDNFEENLKKFKNIMNQNDRRNLDNWDSRGLRTKRNIKPDPVDDILLQHAVPIVMNIDGYLKAPLK